MSATEVIIVDDHDATRHEMASLIDEENDFRVVGEACSGEDGVALAREHDNAIVVMDIVMPGMSGIEAARKLVSRDSGIKVLALSNHSGNTMAKAVVQSGAQGYVRKDQAYEELIPAMRAVARGEQYFGKRISE